MPVYLATDQGTMMLLGLMSIIAVSHLHQDSPALDALVLLAGLQVGPVNPAHHTWLILTLSALLLACLGRVIAQSQLKISTDRLCRRWPDKASKPS